MFDNLYSDINRYSYGGKSSFLKLIIIASTKLGFWAVINYRIGVFLREKTSKIPVINIITRIFTMLSKVFIEVVSGVSISYHSKIEEGILIAHFSNIIIGDGVVIGKGATLHQGVTIGVSGRNENRGVPLIGDDFFAGANAVVAGRIILGNNVAVSANSFVNHDVDSDSIVNNQQLKIVSRKGAQHV
ncbi:serine O-acetyltransferase [Vibrio crassostreae]|uniref:serine O-acetyltransferase n=1 Tax=Vibrio crassostreae TaxID=246167 RepID=UPI000F47BA34|nr:serine acetyltransferase [Vibrio crassostreae]ROP20135.1 serine O-acetyltransferase [Vibrio crassostreae]ROP21774.1 serine O-acetyltransferase [Vibrio crassostreae]RPE97612.1 serine O-acetyltransferase [Vibrio crassostreae]RPE99918.1 serine O-acetyltransferase [Vibrio crassostreae]TCN70912.1 serine O-acetyltransferase [Vibrio crassostreae]